VEPAISTDGTHHFIFILGPASIETAVLTTPPAPQPISQQQIARVLPNHARRDESPRKKKTRKMEGEKESSSSGLHSDSSPSSSLSSLPASGYVDSINQSSPLDCYVFAPSSSSLSAATAMDYGSTGRTPQPTSPAHYYEPVYMDASPTASGPFAPRVIFQAYGAPVVAAAPAPSPPARVRDWNEVLPSLSLSFSFS
jgi:hypothetical protein